MATSSITANFTCNGSKAANAFVRMIHESKLSKTNIRLISRFAERNEETGLFTAALYLFAQIGKNYALPEDCRISGGDLISLALDKLRAAQDLVGGKKDRVQFDQMIRVLENVA